MVCWALWFAAVSALLWLSDYNVCKVYNFTRLRLRRLRRSAAVSLGARSILAFTRAGAGFAHAVYGVACFVWRSGALNYHTACLAILFPNYTSGGACMLVCKVFVRTYGFAVLVLFRDGEFSGVLSVVFQMRRWYDAWCNLR